MPAVVNKIDRPKALARTKKMLKEVLNHTVKDSTAKFPPGVGRAQREGLQDDTNENYFLPWECDVSTDALGDSTTCSEMTTAIMNAIDAKFKE